MIQITDSSKYIHGNRDPRQVSLRISQCQKHHLEKDSALRSILNKTHTLFMILSGSLYFCNHKIEKGTFIYISKYSHYEFITTKSADAIEISFDYSDNIPLFNKPFQIVKAPLDIQDCMNKIYFNDYFYNCLPGVKEGLLLVILNTLNSLCDTHSDELKRYQKCCEWIDLHAKSYITAEDTASAMHCTVAHLNRIVKKHSGKCLSELIIERRISEIKQLCKREDLDTTQIAAQLDFSSPELLRKFFKYHTGVSFKSYRLK